MLGPIVIPATFLFVLLVLYSYFDPEFTETYINSVFKYIDDWGNTKVSKVAPSERRRTKPTSSRSSSSRHSPATVTPTGQRPSSSTQPASDEKRSSRSSRRGTPNISPTTLRRRALHRMQREAQREVLQQQLNRSTPEKDIWADFTPKETHHRSASTLSISRSHSNHDSLNNSRDELRSPKSARSSSSRSKVNGSSRSTAQTPSNGDYANASYTDDWKRYAGSANHQHDGTTHYQRTLQYTAPQQQPTNGFYDVSLQNGTSMLPTATPPLHPHTRNTSTPVIPKSMSSAHFGSPPPSIYASMQQQHQYTMQQHSPAVSPEPSSATSVMSTAHSPHPYYQYQNSTRSQPPAVVQYSISPQPLSPGFYSTAATASPTFAAQRGDVHEHALDY